MTTGTINVTFRLGDLAETPEARADAQTSADSPGSAGSPGGAAAAPPTRVASPALRSFDLFPTRIWQARLDSLFPQLSRWVQEVLAMRAASPSPAGRTNRQGWNSTDMSVLERPAFGALRQAVRAACAAALGEMGRDGTPFSLQSWVNLHDRGGFNFLHLHEGSLLSGSFYLQRASRLRAIRVPRSAAGGHPRLHQGSGAQRPRRHSSHARCRAAGAVSLLDGALRRAARE